MKMRIQEKKHNLNFENFTKEFAKINFEKARVELNKKDCSTREIKGLATEIMGFVSEDSNVELMNRIAAKVESWSKDKTLQWRKSLVEYGRTNDDIVEIYCGKKDNIGKFILVVEQETGDFMLSHNDFCFELFDEYEDIKDFLVLDVNEFGSMRGYYTDYVKIYQRGK